MNNQTQNKTVDVDSQSGLILAAITLPIPDLT